MKNRKDMRRFWFRRGLRFLVFGALFIVLTGLVVMSLWNALLPEILGVKAISFGQAIGIMLLSRLLFGGFGGGGFKGGRFGRGRQDNPRQGDWKQKLAERWQNLTPEQREQMRNQWRGRCGPGRRGFGFPPDTPEKEQPTEPEKS